MSKTYKLIHHQLCPLSRQIRVLMDELQLEYTLTKEDYWVSKPSAGKAHAIRILPILEPDTDGNEDVVISGYYPIIEFLHENFKDFFLMPSSVAERSKVRHCLLWFNEKFLREVSKVIVDEKVIRPITKSGEPRGEYLRIAKNNLNYHFHILEQTLDKQSYVTSEKLTAADIATGAHISIVDYFGEIAWDMWPCIKEWYAILKSRPSFRAILADRIPGLSPPKYYDDPDF